MIRQVEPKDIADITDIYNKYIADTIITFEEEAVTQMETAGRIEKILNDKYPFLVYIEAGQVVGYAYAGPFRTRAAYRFSTELSVYADIGQTGRGIGTAIYTELVALVKEGDYRMAYGGIALPNDSCVRLHEKLGFKKVAHFSKVGFKLDQWVDVGFWELELK